jgi:regulator of sigma E protease
VSFITNTVLFLLIMNIAVFVHELAHYLAAKSQGVGVKSFSIGFGPILSRFQWRDTEWRISLLPLGGYVEIEGMGPTQAEDGTVIPPTTGMASLSWLGKVWILFAGPLSNVVLAILIVAAVLMGQGKQTQTGFAQLYQVLPGSQAEKTGFQKDDVIRAINGVPVTNFEQVRASLLSDGTRIYSLTRAGQALEKQFTWAPVVAGGTVRPKFGVSIGPQIQYISVGPLEAVTVSTTTLIGGIPATIQAFFKGVVGTFSFSKENVDVSGPVGTATAIGQAAEQGPWPVLLLAGLINLSLGIFNLLPIPGLDGGRIVLSSIQAIRRRPFAPGQEEFINFLGFAFVLVFIGLVTFRDLARLGG